MLIDQYLDVAKLEQYITDGIVERRRHPSLPLSILCYSRRATYENIWDDITIKTRGLIVADDGTIVSRPFEKFFNVGTKEFPETWPSNLPTVVLPHTFEKLDGSLGIHWNYLGKEGVASKGSFQSDHAMWATNWYDRNCPNAQWPVGYTPVFEMICQAVQRHVVYYDIKDQLVLLALINNETGEEMDYNNLYHYAFLNGMQTVEIFHKTVGQALDEDRENKEGYILSWPRKGQTPLKVKVKHETFLKLQKIVHRATPKTILEEMALGNYNTVQMWINNGSSPELGAFVQGWFSKFGDTYSRYLNEASKIVKSANLRFGTRAEKAAFILNDDNKHVSSLSFALLDGNEEATKRQAWKLVKIIYEEELTRPVMGDPYDDDEEGYFKVVGSTEFEAQVT